MRPNSGIAEDVRGKLAAGVGQGETLPLTVRVPSGTAAVLTALGLPTNRSAAQVAAETLGTAAFEAVYQPQGLAAQLQASGERLHHLLNKHGVPLHQAVQTFGLSLGLFADPARMLEWLTQPHADDLTFCRETPLSPTQPQMPINLDYFSAVLGTRPDYLTGQTPFSGRPLIPLADAPEAGLQALRAVLTGVQGQKQSLTVYGSEEGDSLAVCLKHQYDQHNTVSTEVMFVRLEGQGTSRALIWLTALRLAMQAQGHAPEVQYRLVNAETVYALACGHVHPKLTLSEPLNTAIQAERRIGADPNGFAPARLAAQAAELMAAAAQADTTLPFTLGQLHTALNIKQP